MKQNNWDSYWDKKINEHFNVKPTERIVLREFVENVFNEKYGITEAAIKSNLASFGSFINGVFVEKPLAGGTFEKIPNDVKDQLNADGKVETSPKGKQSVGRLDSFIAAIKAKHPFTLTPEAAEKSGVEYGEEIFVDLIPDIKNSMGGDIDKETLIGILQKDGIDHPLVNTKTGDVLKITDIEKTEILGGRSDVTGADWEGLLTWAVNSTGGKKIKLPKVPDGTSSKVKKFVSDPGIQEKVLDLYNMIPAEVRKQKFEGTGQTPGKASETWTKAWQQAFGEGSKPGSATMTSKTDVMASTAWQMSFKKAGGAQLMSGGKGETLATIHAVSNAHRDKFANPKAIDELAKTVLNDFIPKFEDYKNRTITIIQSDLEAAYPGIKKKFQAAESDAKRAKIIKSITGGQGSDGEVFRNYLNADKMHNDATGQLNGVLDLELNKKNEDLKKTLGASAFRYYFTEEAMTGKIKFDSKIHVANSLFTFDPSKKRLSVKKIDEKTISAVANDAKYYVSFKTGGTSYSATKAGITTVVEREIMSKGVQSFIENRSREIYKKELEILQEKIDRESRELLVELSFTDGANFLKDKARQGASLVKKGVDVVSDKVGDVIDSIPDFAEKLQKFFSMIGSFVAEAYDAALKAIKDSFLMAVNVAKKIMSDSGLLAAFAVFGLQLEEGGDENGMESNPDVAEILLGS
jgi:hypothetical protein